MMTSDKRNLERSSSCGAWLEALYAHVTLSIFLGGTFLDAYFLGGCPLVIMDFNGKTLHYVAQSPILLSPKYKV